MNNDEVPILCNQENFILKSNGYTIQKALPDFHTIFRPATKVYFKGRPKNGMFIALPINLRSYVKDISPNNERVQVIILDTEGKKLMIIKTYFPNDPKRKDNHVDPDLENCNIFILCHDM